MSKIEYIYPINDSACRSLWLAVIHKGMEDLISEPTTYEGEISCGEARRWFFMTNGSFPLVCHLAGVEPYYVRKRAREIQNNPSLLVKHNV